MRSVEDLQRDMAAIRRDLPDHVEGVAEQARTLADWRCYIRNYPWACVALAAAVGYLAVPPRRRIIRLDAESIAEWADRNGVDWHKPKRKSRSGGIAQRLIETAAKAALGAGAAYLGRRVNRLFSEGSQAAPR